MGIDHGDTGSVASVACKGSCGSEAPNPLDVVVVADRTPSMSDSNRTAMVNGIQSMLKTMDSSQQYVALATIHKSQEQRRCLLDHRHARERRGPGGQVGPGPVHQRLPDRHRGDPEHVEPPGSRTHVPASVQQGTSTPISREPSRVPVRYLLGYDNNNLSSLPPREGTVQEGGHLRDRRHARRGFQGWVDEHHDHR